MKQTKPASSRIERLREIIALEEKRALLQKDVQAVNEQIAAIQDELYGPAARRAAAREERKALARLRPKGRKGRGELRLEILEILQAAGKAGATVKELAARIGLKTTNVHSWISINSKKIPILKRIGLARYALTGPADSLIKEAQAARARPARKSGKRAARGAFKAQILDALKKAGAKGISVKELSETLNTPYRNVYTWFATTGKKVAGISKTGPAQYKLAK